MKTLTTLVLLSLISVSALAGSVTVNVPEPGVLGLFATAGVMLFLARKFRK